MSKAAHTAGRKLTTEQIATLQTVADFEFMGGSVALDVIEWRRREGLRKRGLLKFHGRKNVRWDRTFYDCTKAGEATIAAAKGGAA